MICGVTVSRSAACFHHARTQEHMMRFPNISETGGATDDECCPHCHVRLEE
jgi:hypothetical protein